RDISQVRYERPPDCTLRMIEGRLMRAVYNCGSVLHARINTSSVLREIGEGPARELADREAQHIPDFVPRMEPAPSDESDFLTAMGWFAALNPPETRWRAVWGRQERRFTFNRPQRVLLRRARNIPLSFDEIG